eukprot:6200309-Pleurochrysis_carterae.AAC.2
MYIHNWAFVLARQIAETVGMWQLATPAIEFHGRRAHHTPQDSCVLLFSSQACWRVPNKAYFRTPSREGKITNVQVRAWHRSDNADTA